jgi:hypothetical protein
MLFGSNPVDGIMHAESKGLFLIATEGDSMVESLEKRFAHAGCSRSGGTSCPTGCESDVLAE